MPDLNVRHEINCSEDTYWDKLFFDEEYNRRLFVDLLKFPGLTVLEQKNEGDRRSKKVKIDPPLTGLPGPVKKAIGDRFSYVEEGTYDPKTKRYAFKVTPSTMADKTTVVGEITTERLGDHRIARIAKVKIEVKVFMVGGMIEDKILGDMKHSYDAAASFTDAYVKEKGL